MKQRSYDFERIHSEFTHYYGKEHGESEYYTWLNQLNLDETLSYGQTRESIQWENTISFYKEDASNKYYQVFVGFPTRSMNNNVYKEADLIADAKNIVSSEAHPSMNHKDAFWMSPDSRWGTVDIEAAQYDDGAVKAVIKVPKTTLCPACGNGELLYKAIDEHKIVNVSLEGFNPYGTGFTFNRKIPFTLLTKNVLPGIPMARIFPIEAFLPFGQTSQSYHLTRTVKVVGLNSQENKKTTQTQEKEALSSNQTMNGVVGYKRSGGNQINVTFPMTWADKSDVQTGDTPRFEATHTEPDADNKGGPSDNDADNQTDSGDDFGECSECHGKLNAEGECLNKECSKYAGATEAAATGADGIDTLGAVGAKQQVSRVNALSGSEIGLVQAPAKTPTKVNNLQGTKSTGGLLDMPDNTDAKTIQGESIPSLKVKLLKAQQQINGLQAENIEISTKLNEAFTTVMSSTSELKATRTQTREQIDRLEKQVNDLNLEKAKDIVEKRNLTRRLEDMTTSRDEYKQLYEKLREDHEKTVEKYRSTLALNIDLDKKLTSANEEYLDIAKRAEQLEDKVKHVNRITKINTKF